MAEKTLIQLHPNQWKAYRFKKPYGLCLCGTKGGKTFLGAVWTQKKITEFPLGNGLIGAPTNKIMQQATLDTFFNLFPEYRKFYKKQESIIVLPSGGKVYIRSTDEPLAIEGFNLDWAWLDEIGMMSRLVWVIAKGKVAISRGQILGTTNAYYLNWLYKEVYVPAGFINGEDQEKVNGKLVKVGTKTIKRDKQIEIFNWRSIDNPYFPKEFAEREKERMSAAEYARRYEGRFVRMEGLVWEIDESHILEEKDNEQYLKNPERIIGGIDWGFTNPAAILILKIKDGKYYVVDEWKEARRTTNDIIQKISEFNRKHFVQTWYPDPAEPDRIEEMRRANLIVGDVNKDVPLGIGKVQSLFKKHKLFILDNCKELQDELEQYRYETPKEMRDGKEVPLKVNDHLCLSGFSKISMASGKDKLLKDIKVGDLVKTRNGFQKVVASKLTEKNAEVLKIILSNGKELIGTGNHPIYSNGKKVRLDALRYGAIIEVLENKKILLWKKQLSSITKGIIGMVNTTLQLVGIKTGEKDYTKQYGKKLTAKSKKDIVSIIKMETGEITNCITSGLCHLLNICRCTQKKDFKTQNIERKTRHTLKELDPLQRNGTGQRLGKSGTANTEKNAGLEKKKLARFAKFVEKNIKPIFQQGQGFATRIVGRERFGREDVYNLTVENEHNYYANGILVSNCDSLRYSIMGNELSQNYTYQEERAERARIRENRMLKKEFELL